MTATLGDRLISADDVILLRLCSAWDNARVRGILPRPAPLASILDLETVIPAHRIWCVLNFVPPRVTVRFVVDCARRVVGPDHRKAIAALDLIDRWLAGETVTDDELRRASSAAGAAARLSAVAGRAARASAADAAEAAYCVRVERHIYVVAAAAGAARNAVYAVATPARDAERTWQLTRLRELLTEPA